MHLEVTVVAEARADFEMGFGLARRVSSDLGTGHELSSRGLTAGESFTVWSRVCKLVSSEGRSEARRPRRFALSRGPFKGGDAETAWKIAGLFALEGARSEGSTILLVRDTDNESERADGLRREVERLKQNGVPVLLALAHPKREAWVLHGFELRNRREEDSLTRQIAKLGFDPRLNSHRLTAEGRKGKLNAKQVLEDLVENDHDREAVCWQKTSLATLKDRGGRTGLADLLDQLRYWLATLTE